MNWSFNKMSCPSPRPSPVGRGRIKFSLFAQLTTAFAESFSELIQRFECFSLSLRERARVRGKTVAHFSIAVIALAQSTVFGLDLPQRDGVLVLDLPTVLRLANAQNLDVQIAREKLKEARANHESAAFQFFPSVSPGFSYRAHDDLIQAVDGTMIDVSKQSYAPGVTIGGTWEIGDAIYKNLVAKQQQYAAEHGLEAQRQESAAAATQNYFDLLFSQAAVGVAEEAIRISTNYEAQIHEAVAAGLTFKGDELRVRVQAERNRLTFHQALEQQKLASARLAQTLHINPTNELVALDSDFVPLIVVSTNFGLSFLVEQALASRAEIEQTQSLTAAAREAKKGTVYGPWIPSANAQIFAGGLGGDSEAGPSRFGAQEDYFFGLSWKIGPGGLFDKTRIRASDARLKTAQLNNEKIKDEVTRQVVEAFLRVQSLGDQLDSARRTASVAEESLKLTQLRKEFAVGVVLEGIQAEQDLTRARSDYLRLVADFNKAQYALVRALGRF